jgi:signal transduction histidine kinase
VLAEAPALLAHALEPGARYEIIPAEAMTSAADTSPCDDVRLCIPLRADHRCCGAIFVSGCDSDAFDSETTGRVAELLAVALLAREREAVRQVHALKEAAELKLDSVSMLSHEMRTPLASIKGYATALMLDEMQWDGDTRREFLQAIETEADHLTKLVADILEAAAIDSGEFRLNLEPILLPRIAKRVVDKVGIGSDVHRFVLMFPSDFPIVVADSQRIEQVLTNLVDNAVKYSPDGGLILLRGEVGEREVEISVVDQGIGIAPEHLNKLFERFFRALPEQRQRIVGTGLGLPIADAIIRGHGGRIWAASTVGSGTTLAFTLPHPRPDTRGDRG